MLFASDHDAPFDRLDDELCLASRPTADLFAKVIAGVCLRVPMILGKSGRAAGIDRLVEIGAWTDAALALVEIELPMWKVRRAVHDSGEWFCSLSRTPYLPVELDDSVDTNHVVLALAVLRALVEARRRTSAERQSTPRPVPQVLPAPAGTMCCDNFA